MFPSFNCQECHSGSQLIVAPTCPNSHKNIWKSQATVNQHSQGHLTFSAAFLFSTNTLERTAKFFHIANIQWIIKTSYYAIQMKFLAGFVHLNYFRMNTSLVRHIKTYSLMNQQTNEMVTFAVMPIIDINNSNRIEKLNFTKALNELKQKKNLCKSTDI